MKKEVNPFDALINKASQTSRVISGLEATTLDPKVLEALTPLIGEPDVDILEFIESDKFLNQKDIFPKGRWVLDVVVNPRRYLTLFEEYGYDPVTVPESFDEVVLVMGMKSSKTNIAAILLLYRLYKLRSEEHTSE